MLSFNSTKDNASPLRICPKPYCNCRRCFPAISISFPGLIKLIKDTPSQIIKQKRKTSELKRGLSSRFLMHQKEKTKQGTRNSNTKKNHLNSQPREETEDRHSLYGKKEIENESEKPEDKTVF
jgi:hypothetical protein